MSGKDKPPFNRNDQIGRRRNRKQDPYPRPKLEASGASVIALKNIDVGEPDANAEFFLAQRSSDDPMYLQAFYDWEGVSNDALISGKKFILFGQKGTGKTAVLRNLENRLREDYSTGFVVFRKEIIEEAQLASIAATFSANIMVDEEKIKESKFYYHAMKRLLITFLLSKCAEIDEIPDEIGWFKSLYDDLRKSSIGQIASLVTDSVIGSLEAVKIDVEKATRGIAKVDASKAIKRSNDAFQKFAFEKFRAEKMRVRLFLDEMHFAYRDTDSLSADASLVRDTILAVRELNERLIESGLDSLIYLSIRSEFLEHQEIAVADVSHTIESYGIELSWESAPYNKAHPMFDLVLKRLNVTFENKLTKEEMLLRYIPQSNIDRFLEYTWGKPRDIIRYFKAAMNAYPNAGSIKIKPDFGNVIRKYSQAAWQDQKAALAAFVPKNSIPKVEEALQEIANRDLDKSKVYTKGDVSSVLSSAFGDMKSNGVTYDMDEFIKLLYIVGVFFVTYRDASGQRIIHQFHRGNRKPYSRGEFHIHRAVARALS